MRISRKTVKEGVPGQKSAEVFQLIKA